MLELINTRRVARETISQTHPHSTLNAGLVLLALPTIKGLPFSRSQLVLGTVLGRSERRIPPHKYAQWMCI
jgi:RNase P protein component